VRGIEVLHIQDETHLLVHPYTSPARLLNGQLSYAQGQGEPLGEKSPGSGSQISLEL
jgi:hypothetical protein